MKSVYMCANRTKTKLVQIACLGMLAVISSLLNHTLVALGEDRPTRTQPSPETTSQFVRALKASSSTMKHGLVRFAHHPTEEERNALKSAGIHVLSPYEGTTYRVRVDKKVDIPTARARGLETQLLPMEPEDRVAPKIWRDQYDRYTVTPPGKSPVNYVLNDDGTINVTVQFHKDVSETAIKRVLRRYTRKMVKQSDEAWITVITPRKLKKLAQEDLVEWIDAGPPPSLQENDATRTTIGVDALQNFSTTTGQVQGLGGLGIHVGIFDNGVDQAHDDLTPGMLLATAATGRHGTHVAGIVGGRGVLSNGTDSWGLNNNGAPFQWRGMAPQAQLIEAAGGNGANTWTHMELVTLHGMDVSNHSYSFSFDGTYDLSNQTRDQIVRGVATINQARVPARLHVYSAGNHGNTPQNGGEQVGYFSLTKQVKNGLIVGNWDAARNMIARTSSLGPAHDGRIKPDVVAPGVNIRSTGFCEGDETHPICLNTTGPVGPRQDFYRPMDGTSMAAPAVTGAIALWLQQYAATYGGNLNWDPPPPSTIRGSIIHTATDIQENTDWFNNPDGAVRATAGPDFITGWGLIDAERAVRIAQNRLLLADAIIGTCDTITYRFQVPPGTPGQLRVTLAWDDFAGNPALPDTSSKLVNDLDLILIDPQGEVHYPWQLDQQILDAAGKAIPDAQQKCGTAVTVRRQFMPAENPNFVQPHDPNPDAVNDVIPAGGVPAATRGRDHLNNVEVVDIPAIAGTWQAQVVGFNVPQGAQFFSLVGQKFVGADLVIQSITHSPSTPNTQGLITFTAVIRNDGTDHSGPSTLSFRVGGETPPGQTFPVPSLAPGQTYTVSRQEKLAVAQKYSNTVVADFNKVVGETNEHNNQRTDNYTVLPAQCVPGTPRTVSCQAGSFPGTRIDVCEEGVWRKGNCIRTSECMNGDERYLRCSYKGGLGFQRQLCRNGSWVKSGGCLKNMP